MLASALLFTLLASVVNAHFQLQFPPPRGPFVEDNEPTFCDGYNSVNTSRTVFPLKGGFYSLNSEHPTWTAAAFVSTAANPTAFNNFTLVNNFFQIQGEGLFCLPLDFSTSNFTGLQNGQNITLEIVFDGGDGALYQCADLTLSSTASISSSVSCTNATNTSTTGSSSTSTTSSSSNTATSSGGSSGAAAVPATSTGVLLSIAFGFFGLVLSPVLL